MQLSTLTLHTLCSSSCVYVFLRQLSFVSMSMNVFTQSNMSKPLHAFMRELLLVVELKNSCRVKL